MVLLLWSSWLKAQEPQSYTELVLHCPELSPVQVNTIEKQLNCLDGVHLSGYYLPARCLFITYEKDKIAKSSVVTSVLVGLNKKIKARAVKGYTIYDIIDKGLPPEFTKVENKVISFSEE